MRIIKLLTYQCFPTSIFVRSSLGCYKSHVIGKNGGILMIIFFVFLVAYLYETSDWKNQCIGLPPAWEHWLAYVPLCQLRTREQIKEASTKAFYRKTVLL